MATRRKPHDPAKALLAALARQDRDAEAQRLESQGATVKRDPTGHILSAYRSNVFNLLLSRGAITPAHHDAASRLADEWRTWKGLDGRPELPMEFVSGSGELGVAEAGFASAKRRDKAGFKVAGWICQLERDHGKLLCAFMVASVEEDRPMAWRGVVEREIGETRREKQTALVVEALDALVGVLQGRERRAA